MRIITSTTLETSSTSGLPVLLLSSDGAQGPTARRLAGLGGHVDVLDELFAALSEVIDDPAGYAMFVIDCDGPGVGGLLTARHAVQMMGDAMHRVPVILISRDCVEQQFPMDRTAPIVLRAPLSAVSIKVGFEHALRGRKISHAA